MQVSKIFIGVNIATSLSLVLAGQAKAADKGVTADFLKSSLNELTESTVNSKPVRKASAVNPASIAKFSSPKSVETRKSFNLDSLNFKSSKHLPSRQELALKEDRAQMASLPETTKTLSGSASVKSYSNSFYLSDDIQANTKSAKAKRAHKRQSRRQASKNVQTALSVVTTKLSAGGNKPAIAEQKPVMPGQVGHPCASIHSMDARAPHSVASNEAVTSPHLSNNEQVQLAKLARVLFLKDKLARPSMSTSTAIHSPLDSNMTARQRVDAAYSKNGPPPFPLNLIPEPAMKDFLTKARNRKSMISTYPNAFARTNHQPNSGFTGYSHQMKGGFTSYSSHALNYSHNYSRTPKSNISHSGYHHVNHSAPSHREKVHISQPKNVVHKAHAKVATYGPYGSYSPASTRGL